MAEKCNTPECLRGVDNAGEQCMPCELGMPPMKNAKSPHSYTSKVKGNTAKPSHKKPKKGIITEEKGGKLAIVIDNKGRRVRVKPKKSSAQIEQLQKAGFSARKIGQNKYGLHQVVYASLENRKEAIQELRSIKKENNAKAWLLVKDLEQ